MQDYYGYHPRRIPSRHIAVTGFAGSKASLVAAAVAQLTGLGFTDLDRLIEHSCGHSLAELVLTKGERAMRKYETELLEQSLSSAPPGVLALGEGALLVGENRDRIRLDAHLIYVELSAFQLFYNINSELSRHPNKYSHLFTEAPENPQIVQSLLNRRLVGYRAAELTISGARSGTFTAARRIIAHFGL